MSDDLTRSIEKVLVEPDGDPPRDGWQSDVFAAAVGEDLAAAMLGIERARHAGQALIDDLRAERVKTAALTLERDQYRAGQEAMAEELARARARIAELESGRG